MKSGFVLTTLALIGICASSLSLPASTLIESWEGTGIDKLEHQLGGWHLSEHALAGLSVDYSQKHATDGSYSLEVTTPGGWTQFLMYGENSDFPLRNPPLYKVLSDKMTLDLDVYTGEMLEWSKIEVALQGNALPWTQLTGNTFGPGGTTMKYLIPPKVSEAISHCDQWFQMIIILNTNAAGKVYIDNLSAE